MELNIYKERKEVKNIICYFIIMDKILDSEKLRTRACAEIS